MGNFDCDAAVLYAPLADEPDYRDASFPLIIPKNTLTLPSGDGGDPFDWAETCAARFKSARVAILIPGKKFDVTGTRHGRGSGWYDRFLSRVPEQWVRIGVAKKSQVSRSRLPRESWSKKLTGSWCRTTARGKYTKPPVEVVLCLLQLRSDVRLFQLAICTPAKHFQLTPSLNRCQYQLMVNPEGLAPSSHTSQVVA